MEDIMKIRKFILIACLLLLLFFCCVSCICPRNATFTANSPKTQGFFGGLQHGFCVLYNLCFCDAVYDYYSNGVGYKLGFGIGIILLFLCLFFVLAICSTIWIFFKVIN